MTETVTIKKYPNRRLYNTHSSQYMTVADVETLVRKGTDFVVIEKSTKRDITCEILLQVIASREDRDGHLLSRRFLADVIRSRETSTPALLAAYLEQSLETLEQNSSAEQQAPILEPQE